jgi:hypothetical protein
MFDGYNWTWMSGSDVTCQYGELGTPDESNMPSCRYSAVGWTDKYGNLWLFGGMLMERENYIFSYYYLNDLWKYDGGNWTRMSGNSSMNQYGSYGDKGVASPSNLPGGRYAAVSWTDKDGLMWMFGGIGYSSSGSTLSKVIILINDVSVY